MGGGDSGGGGGGGTSTTVQSVPDELKPLASAYTGKAIELSNTPYTPYGGQRVADLNTVQGLGLGATVNRAIGGSATMDNAESNLNGMMSAGPNPYLSSMVDSALGKVKTNVNSQFSGENFGTTAHQGVLAESLGNTAANMYGSAYNADQNNRLQAIGMAPTFGNAAYQDASQLMNAGQVVQDQSQRGLDIGYQDYLAAQNDPYKKLAAMAGVFQGGGLGASSTTTSNPSSSGGGK
jgi:hypothetical protein